MTSATVTAATIDAPTINPAEAAHFGRLAAEWWDPKGSSAMLHRLTALCDEGGAIAAQTALAELARAAGLPAAPVTGVCSELARYREVADILQRQITGAISESETSALASIARLSAVAEAVHHLIIRRWEDVP